MKGFEHLCVTIQDFHNYVGFLIYIFTRLHARSVGFTVNNNFKNDHQQRMTRSSTGMVPILAGHFALFVQKRHEEGSSNVQKVYYKKDTLSMIYTWYPKHPFFNGCFSWMIPNLSIKNCCFTKHPFKTGCLGYQVHRILYS